MKKHTTKRSSEIVPMPGTVLAKSNIIPFPSTNFASASIPVPNPDILGMVRNTCKRLGKYGLKEGDLIILRTDRTIHEVTADELCMLKDLAAEDIIPCRVRLYDFDNEHMCVIDPWDRYEESSLLTHIKNYEFLGVVVAFQRPIKELASLCSPTFIKRRERWLNS
jgi:hypothetical protein